MKESSNIYRDFQTIEFPSYDDNEKRKLIFSALRERQESTTRILVLNSLLDMNEDITSSTTPSTVVRRESHLYLESLSSVLNNTNNNALQKIRLLVLENHYLTEQCCCKILEYKLKAKQRVTPPYSGNIPFQKNNLAMDNRKREMETSIIESNKSDNLARVVRMNLMLQRQIPEIHKMTDYKETYTLDLVSYSLSTASKEVQDVIPTLIKMENKALSMKAHRMMLYTRLRNWLAWASRNYIFIEPEVSLPPQWF